MESTRNFKIRKTGKTKSFAETLEMEEVANLNDLRIAQDYGQDKQKPQENKQQLLKTAQYENDQQNTNCYRFPHSSFCGCISNCLLESFDVQEMSNGLYFGNFVSGLKTRHLLDLGITHVLNVTCKAYTKRQKYFSYCDIDLRNTTEEDAKKFFRLSNRFIKQALGKGGKVLIHCSQLQFGVIMGCAFMIGIMKVPLVQCLRKIGKEQIQISPHFQKQLQAYDLQKMAFVSIQRD